MCENTEKDLRAAMGTVWVVTEDVIRVGSDGTLL